MYEPLLDIGVRLLSQYGLIVLLVVFTLEGALVGKLIPTRSLFIAAVLVAGTNTFGIVSVFLVAVIGATVGQLVLFGLIRYTDVTPDDLPVNADLDGKGRVVSWFDRWGLSAVAISNTLPIARGSLTVPVALTDENALRFSSASLAGSSLYAIGLLAIALGVESVVTGL